ncbi:MAG TPA: menaquinone biosynthesis protein [Phycisphaerales bacterium]|nr:menaquinone biosynthesis protein [Phycisphaerales bacterium]
MSFLNTLPLIEGLGKLEDARLTLTAPSRLIDLLLGDEIDIGLVSIIDAQRAPTGTPLAIVPCGMIGCDGPTMTVRLFSRRPPNEIGELHADVDSHTSVALARIILEKSFGAKPRLVDFDAESFLAGDRSPSPEEWPGAMLMIGDKVVTHSPPVTLYPHQLDLGEEWKKLTGLPFVYAAWMCRAGIAGSELVRTAAALLDRQRRHNATRLDWIVEARAPVRGWPAGLARTYLRDLLRFEVTPRHVEAVERFFDLAHECGVIAERRPTLWA